MNLREPEGRGGLGEDEIAGESELGAGPEGPALDERTGGDLARQEEPHEGVPGREEVTERLAVRRQDLGPVAEVLAIWEWERRVKQTVVIDLEMAADIRRAAATDRIEDTLDYKKVAKRLLAFVGDSQCHLVETLAEQIARVMIVEFGVSWVKVRLNKPGAIRGARDVGIEIERRQSDFAGDRLAHG